MDKYGMVCYRGYWERSGKNEVNKEWEMEIKRGNSVSGGNMERCGDRGRGVEVKKERKRVIIRDKASER